MTVSMDLTKLGSPSALSLFANAETIPSLVAAGAVLAVTAASFTYDEFKNYQEKKHREKIEQINALYALHLRQIVVLHRGKIHGFPPIFQRVDNKYQSMHFTPDQVKDIGSNIPHGTDIALSSYRESVRAAIRKLREYYFARKTGETVKSNDVTAGVLCYLMHMLDTKCLNFLGYDYDIAYLDAICKFINAYSSQKNGEKSQIFSRLGPVYTHLLRAKQHLEKHKEVLLLQETVAELKDSCGMNSDRLIRILVKMVVKDPDTDLADSVDHDELKEGILRRHYIHTEKFGIELRSDSQIDIPESIFSEWIKKLSDYYLRSLSTELKDEEDKLYSPDEFFYFLNKAKSTLGRKLFGRSKEQALIEDELKHIRKVFRESGNFISTRYNKVSKKFEIVSDPLHLIDRSLIMANIAKLAHEVISLQYLCAHLLKSIHLLGDIYVSNPEHFCQIFQVLERLCQLIQEDTQLAKRTFRELQQDNENNMQLEEKEVFPNQVKDILELVYGEIKDLGEQIKECRQMAVKTIKTRTIKSVKYEMLGIARNISKMYFDNSEEFVNENLYEPSESSSEHGEMQSETNSNEAQPENIQEEINENSLIESLDHLSASLYECIWEIQKNEMFRSKNYFKMFDALLLMKNKSLALIGEHSNSSERQDKAEKTLALTLFLFKETLNFLKKPTSERQSVTSNFYNKVHEKLNNQENNTFIDRHNNKASRFIYTHICSYGMFRTDTRKKLDSFEGACKKASLS